MKALVRMDAVSVTIRGNKALERVDFTLNEGQHTFIHGHNGSGKSTLLRVLRGEIYPDQKDGGEVCWFTAEGPEYSPMVGREMMRLASSAQLENYIRKDWPITGLTLLLSGFSDTPLIYIKPNAQQHEAVRELAKELGISRLVDVPIATYSHGQLRVMLLARACMQKPKVLLLDEFTDGLDAKSRQRVGHMLEQLAEQTTIAAVAHRPDTLPACIGREVGMHSGHIVYDGARRAASPESMPPAPPAPVAGQTLIAIENADVFIEGVKILHNINWTIRQGEHWALVGANGSGKSTLLRLITGVENAALGGSIQRFLPGQGPGLVVEMERMRRGIGFMSDKLQAEYTYELSGEELVWSGFERSVGLFREITEQEQYEAAEWLRRLEAQDLAQRSIRNMSTGQLRKLMLARALVGRPDIVLLDEPCSGLDSASRAHFLRLLDDVAASGVSVLMVTHHEADIIPAITHIARIEDGRLRAAPRSSE